MTPSFMGRIATMLPGVRPSISFAALPTASTLFVILLTATIDGSRTTMPRPSAKTSVFAVPRSIARSLEKIEKNERNAKKKLSFPPVSVLDQDPLLAERLEPGAADGADGNGFQPPPGRLMTFRKTPVASTSASSPFTVTLPRAPSFPRRSPSSR